MVNRNSNGPKRMSRNSRDCTVLCNWVFCSFVLADEPFAKPLQSPETCVLGNNTLFGKLVSSSELLITFEERFKVTSAPFFINDSNLLSCELDNFMLKVLYYVILY